MQFISTRESEKVTGVEAIVRGMPGSGGLYVPEAFPAISMDELDTMLGFDYAERAAFIFGKYFEEYKKEELLEAFGAAFSAFEGDDPVPLVRMDNGMYMLELFHGPTCAYPDLSVAAMPYLLQKGRALMGIKDNLLVVTAGADTSKAALESFRDKDGVKVVAFFPEDGASKMQKLQLLTQDGENLNVVAVRGTLDECGHAIKKLFRSEKCAATLKEKGYLLTTVGSLNVARIVLQTVYFFSAYLDLVSANQIKMGEKVNFCVTAGNLANVLSAYYAKCMGLPIGKLICASNKNSVFTEFIKTGNYDAKRPFFRTMSPALDVANPTNLERLVFELAGRDAMLTVERMKLIATTGKCSVRPEEAKKLQETFVAGHTSEDDTVECIYEFFEEYGYPMDTHTGVAMHVAMLYEEKLEEDPMSEKRPFVVLFTASPYKFPQDVLYALTGNDVKDSFKGVKRVHLLTAMKVPEALKAVRYKPLRFKTLISADKMFDEVIKFIG